MPTPEELAQLVFAVRGEKVMFDTDLAKLYGVTTKALNQAMSRNKARFPHVFAFRVSRQELETLRSQVGTTSAKPRHMWSQIVTTSQRYRRLASFLFHGAEIPAYGDRIGTNSEADLGKGTRRCNPASLDHRLRQDGAPIPPLCEQHRIVAEVARRLSVIEELEAVVVKNLKRAERLRQTILQQAFSGRLQLLQPAEQ